MAAAAESTAARSPTPVVVTVDISVSAISAGVMTMRGDLLARDVLAVDHELSASALFDALDALVQSQITLARQHHKPIGIGIGCAGEVTPNLESVSPTGIGAWEGFPLRERLTTTTRLPVYGDIDCKALALAEGWLGAAVGRDSFLTIVVSAGIGGGIVLNGQLMDGATGNAGHVGHVIVEPNGRRCGCGARGCLEAEASGVAIEAITGRSPSEPTYESMQRTGRLVGRAAASVCNVLDLDLVVIGGSVALGFGATFFNAAQETVDELAKVDYSRGARVTPARLGDRGPLIGAGAVAIRGLGRRRAARRAAG
jgi:glucokinase